MNDDTKTCVLCGRTFDGWGNDPYPLASHGECCDECNSKVVEARLRRLGVVL